MPRFPRVSIAVRPRRPGPYGTGYPNPRRAGFDFQLHALRFVMGMRIHVWNVADLRMGPELKRSGLAASVTILRDPEYRHDHSVYRAPAWLIPVYVIEFVMA